MLPGPVLVLLRVLSWLAIPLWPVDAAGAFVFDWRGVFLVSTLTVVATGAALHLHGHDRVDKRIADGLAAHRQSEAEIARIAGAAVESGLAAAAPIRRASGGLPLLRPVPDYPAS